MNANKFEACVVAFSGVSGGSGEGFGEGLMWSVCACGEGGGDATSYT